MVVTDVATAGLDTHLRGRQQGGRGQREVRGLHRPAVGDRGRRGTERADGRLGGEQSDQVGYIDGGIARFGKSYIGEPDVIAAELAADDAVQAADTLLLTVPNQLGVEYNAHLLETIARHIAPAIGWSAAGAV